MSKFSMNGHIAEEKIPTRALTLKGSFRPNQLWQPQLVRTGCSCYNWSVWENCHITNWSRLLLVPTGYVAARMTYGNRNWFWTIYGNLKWSRISHDCHKSSPRTSYIFHIMYIILRALPHLWPYRSHESLCDPSKSMLHLYAPQGGIHVASLKNLSSPMLQTNLTSTTYCVN